MSDLPARFWARVDKSSECWIWTGAVTSSGYGKTSIAGRQVYVHRAVYESEVGRIPDGAQIDHRCRVKLCVRPAHLQAVTPSLNMQNRDGMATSGTGVRGVHWVPRLGKYRVQAKAAGRIHSGGCYATLEEATAAAVALRDRLMENNLPDRVYQVHSSTPPKG